ncbi:Hypothetical_protein [Hexamita inflata]|uniref:Hypothetical_protein n=1 Tax=Hexamita inflata TaxID=28002 RepID=A0AA86N898_9EUKA|nr:Hypothetical protein HINF_LOCUS2323 [Hexamita inflata]
MYMNFSSYMLSGPLTFSGFDQRDYNAKRELYSKNTPQNKTVPSQTNQNTTKTDEKNQKTVQKQVVTQNATNSKQSPQNKQEISQGQLITLPNGEVGVFIPLTQSQQHQVYKAQQQFSQSQQPQFYQPQPIHQNFVQQDQIYQPLQVCQVLEMPQMPNMM